MGGADMTKQTRHAILSAFTELLKRKPFSKITIGDITAECGIARMTFYYHFDDIYDLLEWTIEEKIREAVKTDFTYDTWKTGLLSVYRATLKEKNFFLKVFPSIDLRRLEQYLMHVAKGFISGVVEEKLQKMAFSICEEEKQMVCNIYGYSMVGIFLQWISDGMKEDPASLVDRFCTILSGSMEMTLQKAATFKNEKE